MKNVSTLRQQAAKMSHWALVIHFRVLWVHRQMCCRKSRNNIAVNDMYGDVAAAATSFH